MTNAGSSKSNPPAILPKGSHQLRLGFAGTPVFAATILRHLIQAELAPVVVYTRPDKRQGRGRKASLSPVKQLAAEHQLPLEQPPTLKRPEFQQRLAEHHVDLLIVAAYGLILPEAVLKIPPLGCLNVHASLLPRWRGAAPIERAIMAGDTETGICLMGMEAGLDTGPVFASRAVAITDETQGAELEAQLAALGGAALVEFLSQDREALAASLADGVPQNEADATYAHKLTAADAVLDWRQPAAALARQVRALSTRMPAVAQRGELKVQVLQAQAQDSSTPGRAGEILAASKRGIEVATGAGSLVLTRVKLNRGKGNPLLPADLLNGYRDQFEVSAYFELGANKNG